jgi:NADH-quinone oxidoreductase subunit F
MPLMPLLTAGVGERDLTRLENYRYEALEKAVRTMTPEEVTAEVVASGLRGRGGAGFPTGRKWQFLPNDGRPRYLVANGDESEPGSFSNRLLIERNPHQIVEGVLIAAYAIQARLAIIYLRGEFYEGAEVLERCLADCRAAGIVGPRVLGSDFACEVHLHRGAGAYICGEESALLESIEGRRGHPRVRPPFPAVAGLYGMPTVVNNVETLSNVPHVVRNGASWFASLGPEKSPGTKIVSVCGHVRRPGCYEILMGTPLREVVEEHAGGVRDGRRLKMVLPAGASSAAVTPERLDTPLDFDSMAQAGTMLGSAGMIVLDETACAVRVALWGERFYAHESCGKCTPCREGTAWARKVLERLEEGRALPDDVDVLRALCGQMSGKCLCPLGDFAVTYLRSALKLFPEEFEEHLARGCGAA